MPIYASEKPQVHLRRRTTSIHPGRLLLGESHWIQILQILGTWMEYFELQFFNNSEVAKLESHLVSKNPLEIVVLRTTRSWRFVWCILWRWCCYTFLLSDVRQGKRCLGPGSLAIWVEWLELEWRFQFCHVWCKANWEDVATNIKQQLRAKGFQGDVEVRFDAQELCSGYADLN